MADYLVCAHATAEMAVANSSFDRHCSRCGSRVMIAPSGQRLLRKKRLEIICAFCVPEVVAGFPHGDKVIIKRPAGSRGEMRNAMPNWWRKRN